jgi:acyl-coenzyme A thioesterase PaaI-like protein
MFAPLTDDIRSGIRTARLSVVATMIDVAASDPVLAVWSPDWTATQHLSLTSVSPLKNGPIVVDVRLLKAGKKVVFVSADVYEGNGIEDFDELRDRIDSTVPGKLRLNVAARGLATFAKITRNAAQGVESYDPIRWLGIERRRNSECSDVLLLNDRIGLKVCNSDAGIVEVANSFYVANSIGTINGGAQTVVAEAAAEAMRPGMITADVNIHFVAPVRVGPLRTIGSIMRDASDHSAIMIRLLDAGDGGKIVATATVILQSIR